MALNSSSAETSIIDGLEYLLEYANVYIPSIVFYIIGIVVGFLGKHFNSYIK